MTKRLSILTPVRFGVVGLGLMGKRHCEVIKHVPGALLSAVCDRQNTVIIETGKRYDARPYNDPKELIADPEIDMVVICLPSGIHADIGILAARAGKHVIVEKPIDSQSVSANVLLAECSSAGVKCFVINQNRYSVGLATLKRAVDSGLMGAPILARASVKWFRHDDYYTGSNWRGKVTGEHGGVLMNQAIHSIDTLQWLFGPPDEVVGYMTNSRSTVLETEDTAVAMFRWKSGLLATLEASTSSAPGFDEVYEIQSSVASIHIKKGQLTHWFHQEGCALPAIEMQPCPATLDEKLCLFYRQYLDIISDYSGDFIKPTNAEEAVAVVETVERIYSSALAPHENSYLTNLRNDHL